MKAPELIKTARLVLHRPNQADLVTIFDRYASDPEVTLYLAWPRHKSLADTEGFLAFSDAEWARSPAGPYLIRSKADASLLGCTGLSFEGSDEASTGYVLAKNAWGRGFASEALLAMIQLGRDLALRRIFAYVHAGHKPSARVLEKAGFARDAAQVFNFPNLAGAAQAHRYSLNLPASVRVAVLPEPVKQAAVGI